MAGTTKTVDVYFYEGGPTRTVVENYNAQEILAQFNNLDNNMICIGDIIAQRGAIQKVIPVRE